MMLSLFWSLIKVRNPILVKNLMPISLRNVIYKLISKLIVNIRDGISSSQSIFVDNMLITNNVLIAFEAIRSMFYGKVNNHFALKLNFSIAFDRVD